LGGTANRFWQLPDRRLRSVPVGKDGRLLARPKSIRSSLPFDKRCESAAEVRFDNEGDLSAPDKVATLLIP